MAGQHFQSKKWLPFLLLVLAVLCIVLPIALARWDAASNPGVADTGIGAIAISLLLWPLALFLALVSVILLTAERRGNKQ